MSTISVLVGHYLTLGSDGPAFVCDKTGCARDFGTIKAAQDYIAKMQLNKRAPIFSIHLLTEVPDGVLLEPSDEYYGAGLRPVELSERK